MITQYTIATGRTHDSLSSEVNALIKQGWQPIGGICLDVEYYSMSSPRTTLLQGMVKEAQK